MWKDCDNVCATWLRMASACPTSLTTMWTEQLILPLVTDKTWRSWTSCTPGTSTIAARTSPNDMQRVTPASRTFAVPPTTNIEDGHASVTERDGLNVQNWVGHVTI